MKFYLHTRDGRAFLQDEAGAELAGLDAHVQTTQLQICRTKVRTDRS
jgi:hypothetical protein